MDYYRKHTGYKILKKELLRRYGAETTERLWSSANKNLERLFKDYADIPDCDKKHAFDSAFPRIAMYRALQKELPEDAMPLLEWTVKEAGAQVSKLLRGMTSLPFMRRVFLRIFGRMARDMFGPSAGFEQKLYPTDKNELRFDITSCPYDRYCKLCGCPELTRTFCDSDIYCYGDLSGIKFIRTQTVGTGGECCDFCLKITKK